MSTTYRIAEIAERSGYSPPTLRYYEEIGLLPPPARTGNGYRAYDDATLERLAFITRAKQLGCSLDEIAELTSAWETGHCSPIQSRLQDVVAAKITDTQSRVAELMVLSADLQRAAAALRSHTPDGPCDDRCGCTTTPDAVAAPQPVPFTASPAGGPKPAAADTGAAGLDAEPAASDAVPAASDAPPAASGADELAIACSLRPGDMTRRLDEWNALLQGVTTRSPLPHGVRLELSADTDVTEVARLAAAEQDCCRFFSFSLVIDQRGTALEVQAPPDGQAVLTAVFGAA